MVSTMETYEMAQAPRKTIADRKAAQAAPSFSIKTTQELAGHKAGDTLSLPVHIGGYFRAMLDVEQANHSVLTDQEIVDIVKSVNISDMSPDEAEVERLVALTTAIGQKQGDYDTSTAIVGAAFAGQSTMDEWTHEAASLGEKIDTATAEAISIAVKGKRDWNGAPVVLEKRMVALYGKEGMDEFPPIGSRRQGLKSDTVPPGMSAEEWQRSNSKVEFYLDHTDASGKTKRAFCLVWYANTPEGKAKALTVAQLRELTSENRAIVPGTPQELVDMPTDEAKSRLETLQGEINDAVNRIRAAVRLYQRKREFAEELPHIKVMDVGVLFGADGKPVSESLEEAAKRRKPIYLKDCSNPNPEAWAAGPTLSLGTFFRYDLAKAKVAAAGKRIGLNDLRASLERKKDPNKGKGNQGQQSAGGSTEQLPAIVNPTGLGDYLNRVGQFLDGKGANNAVLRALSSDEGGRVASEIMRISQALDWYYNNPEIKKQALAYDMAQQKATADRDAA